MYRMYVDRTIRMVRLLKNPLIQALPSLDETSSTSSTLGYMLCALVPTVEENVEAENEEDQVSVREYKAALFDAVPGVITGYKRRFVLFHARTPLVPKVRVLKFGGICISFDAWAICAAAINETSRIERLSQNTRRQISPYSHISRGFGSLKELISIHHFRGTESLLNASCRVNHLN